MEPLFLILLAFLTGTHPSPTSVLAGFQTLPEAPVPHYSRLSVSRTIQISVKMEIHKDGISGDDRDYTRNATLSPVVLSNENGLTKTTSFSTQAGDDILVEVSLTLTLRPSDLSVTVAYVFELYRGRNPSISIPAGYTHGSLIASKDENAEIQVEVPDINYRSGDKADITLKVDNIPSF